MEFLRFITSPWIHHGSAAGYVDNYGEIPMGISDALNNSYGSPVLGNWGDAVCCILNGGNLSGDGISDSYG